MEWGARVSGGGGRTRPWVAPSPGKGVGGQRKSPRCGHPEHSEEQSPSPSAKCALVPASPPAAAATGTGTRLGRHHGAGEGGRGLAPRGRAVPLHGPRGGSGQPAPRAGGASCLGGWAVPSRAEGRAPGRPGRSGRVPSADAHVGPRGHPATPPQWSRAPSHSSPVRAKPAGYPRGGHTINNRQQRGLRGRGRRNTDFNEDSFPLV